MAESRQRRKAILRVILRQPIRTQEELVEVLESEGFSASQASVSRDIATLGLSKVEGRCVRVEPDSTTANPLIAKIRRNVLDLRTAGESMVVVDTPPGEASAVAWAIDRLNLIGVAGTVAGDDTIFLAIETGHKSSAVLRRLSKLSG